MSNLQSAGRRERVGLRELHAHLWTRRAGGVTVARVEQRALCKYPGWCNGWCNGSPYTVRVGVARGRSEDSVHCCRTVASATPPSEGCGESSDSGLVVFDWDWMGLRAGGSWLDGPAGGRAVVPPRAGQAHSAREHNASPRRGRHPRTPPPSPGAAAEPAAAHRPHEPPRPPPVGDGPRDDDRRVESQTEVGLAGGGMASAAAATAAAVAVEVGAWAAADLHCEDRREQLERLGLCRRHLGHIRAANFVNLLR